MVVSRLKLSESTQGNALQAAPVQSGVLGVQFTHQAVAFNSATTRLAVSEVIPTMAPMSSRVGR